jgi:hypothetical protein
LAQEAHIWDGSPQPTIKASTPQRSHVLLYPHCHPDRMTELMNCNRLYQKAAYAN